MLNFLKGNTKDREERYQIYIFLTSVFFFFPNRQTYVQSWINVIIPPKHLSAQNQQ